MLDALKFVRGAMKANKLAPELEHYQIGGGRVVGYNGFMALSSPIDIDLEAKPKADLFSKAIEACGDTVAISLTDGGSVSVRSGGFRALVRCTEQEVFNVQPNGVMFEAPSDLTETFSRLMPFISEDASRPWAMGLGVYNGCVIATNNVIIYQVWNGHILPTFNCPRFAVAELVRLKENPTHIQVSDSSVTFHWEKTGRWLRTQILTDEWPEELMTKILSTSPMATEEVPSTLFEALALIAPFANPRTQAVDIGDGFIETGEGDTLASHKVEGLIAGPRFSVGVLLSLKDEATHIDFGTYPKPCPFKGKNSRGVILGQRY
jgi:hypothetical protein